MKMLRVCLDIALLDRFPYRDQRGLIAISVALSSSASGVWARARLPRVSMVKAAKL